VSFKVWANLGSEEHLLQLARLCFLGNCLEPKGRGPWSGHCNPSCCPCSLEGLQSTPPYPHVLSRLGATWVLYLVRERVWGSMGQGPVWFLAWLS
jgi:hypothetical protein